MNTIIQTKVLVRYNGKYLLLKKKKDIHREHIGGWEVPGGKVELGETPSQAGQREIEEETGLSVQIVSELKPLKLEKDSVKTYTHVYLAEAEGEKISLSSEHSKYIWIFPQKVDSLKDVIYKDLLKQYLEEAEKIKQ
ncbi:NUDIX domain-containing protein [Candidatus Woesearchaeota archaeon]|nr:NUDIX domain-containing protein [Candidatus Woesearchaeota archaeon]